MAWSRATRSQSSQGWPEAGPYDEAAMRAEWMLSKINALELGAKQ